MEQSCRYKVVNSPTLLVCFYCVLSCRRKVELVFFCTFLFFRINWVIYMTFLSLLSLTSRYLNLSGKVSNDVFCETLNKKLNLKIHFPRDYNLIKMGNIFLGGKSIVIFKLFSSSNLRLYYICVSEDFKCISIVVFAHYLHSLFIM